MTRVEYGRFKLTYECERCGWLPRYEWEMTPEYGYVVCPECGSIHLDRVSARIRVEIEKKYWLWLIPYEVYTRCPAEKALTDEEWKHENERRKEAEH